MLVRLLDIKIDKIMGLNIQVIEKIKWGESFFVGTIMNFLVLWNILITDTRHYQKSAIY